MYCFVCSTWPVTAVFKCAIEINLTGFKTDCKKNAGRLKKERKKWHKCWLRIDLPGAIWQLSVKGGASWDGCLVLLEDLLTLQAVGALSGRASGQRRSGSCGHPMPGRVSPEGRLVLAGRTLTVHFILHHWYPVKLGAASEKETQMSKVFFFFF